MLGRANMHDSKLGRLGRGLGTFPISYIWIIINFVSGLRAAPE